MTSDEMLRSVELARTEGGRELFRINYCYDEFGRDLYEMEEGDSSKRRYSRQGEKQPFGYTGYRYDPVSGTYFAQAREYRPEFGRFMAEDIKSGRGTEPKTLNRYGYCWNNPVGLVDVDGKEPELPLPLPDSLNLEIEPHEKESNVSVFSSALESAQNPDKDYNPFDLENMPTEMALREAFKKELMPRISVVPVKAEYGITAGVREFTSDWNGVLIISCTGSVGSEGYRSGGSQVAIDWHGNIAVHGVVGTGVEAGASGRWSVGIGFLNVPSVNEAKGFGTEVGEQELVYE